LPEHIQGTRHRLTHNVTGQREAQNHDDESDHHSHRQARGHDVQLRDSLAYKTHREVNYEHRYEQRRCHAKCQNRRGLQKVREKTEEGLVHADRQQRQCHEALAHAAEHDEMATDNEEDDQGKKEIEIAHQRTAATERGVDGFADIESHLRADHFTRPLRGDEDETEDRSHRQAEDQFSTDRQGGAPRRVRQSHRRADGGHAHRQHDREGNFDTFGNSRAAKQGGEDHHPAQTDENENKDRHTLQQLIELVMRHVASLPTADAHPYAPLYRNPLFAKADSSRSLYPCSIVLSRDWSSS